MAARCLVARGQHLDAVVEEALDDLLVVSVTVAGRKLQGILFDSDKRLAQSSGVGGLHSTNGLPSTYTPSLSPPVSTTSTASSSAHAGTTAHDEPPSPSRHQVATLGSNSSPRIGSKRKLSSTLLNHGGGAESAHASKRQFNHSDMAMPAGYASQTEGSLPRSASRTYSASSDSPQPQQRRLSASTSLQTGNRKHSTTSASLSDSDEDTCTQAQYVPQFTGRPRLRGGTKRGRMLLGMSRSAPLEDKKPPSPVSVPTPLSPPPPPRGNGVRLRGGRGSGGAGGRGSGVAPTHGPVQHGAGVRLRGGRGGAVAAAAAARGGVRLRGGRGGRGRGSFNAGSRTADTRSTVSKPACSVLLDSSLSPSSPEHPKQPVASAAPSNRARLRGRGIRRGLSSSMGRGAAKVERKAASYPASPTSSFSSDCDTPSEQKSRPASGCASANSIYGPSKTMDPASDGKRTGRGPAADDMDCSAGSVTSSKSEGSLFGKDTPQLERKSSESSVKLMDGSPLSRRTAASLAATHSLKSPTKRLPVSPTSQLGTASDLDMPLSPVLSFHKNAFKKGDVVWAKMVDSPWWPAVVESIRTMNTSSAQGMQDLSLLFLGRKGSTQTTLLPNTLVSPFVSYFKSKFLPKKRTSTYQRAVREACEMCNVEPPDMPSGPMKNSISSDGASSSLPVDDSNDDLSRKDSMVSLPDIATSGAGGVDAPDVILDQAVSLQDLLVVGGHVACSRGSVAKTDSIESITSLQTHPPASPFCDTSSADSC